ncbi:MAG: FtsQ-type POTRA domain-containing protein [Candidatus Buchananbacteria bacterium]|nr:FtsQ-type POTRA domain-containing protein [Candidatus Buchananbacteria bacterium]
MFFKKKRKNKFANKLYRVERQVRYKNPLKIKKGVFQFKLFRIINLLLILGILGCLYFFIFSNFYNITNVEVTGNEIISTEDVLDITNNYLAKNKLLFFKNNNIFLFSKSALASNINKVVILDNIVIEKILPNTIRINIQEKDVAFKWLTNQQTYLVDQQGIIIKRYYKLVTPKIFQLTQIDPENDNKQNDNLLIIKNLANQDINLGDKIINPQDINFIFNLLTKLEESDSFVIKELSVPNNFPEYITITTLNNWQIHFNLADSVDSQINRLNVLIRDKIKKENLSALDYIDLRLGESIYYKFK